MRRSGVAACILCVLSLLATPPAEAVDRFVSGIADLPLMDGLEEVEESAMVFSTPEGRIIEVTARGAVTREAARAFYESTLPQLGWDRQGAEAWRREKEILRLNMDERDEGLVIQFSLTPQ